MLWTKGRIPSKRPPPTFLRNLCLRGVGGRGGGGGVGAYKVLYSTIIVSFTVVIILSFSSSVSAAADYRCQFLRVTGSTDASISAHLGVPL